MSLLQLHAITLENVIKLQLITITILITPTLQRTHTAVCVITLWTYEAAQVINQWGNCLKFMVTHRIYMNGRDICKHLSFIMSTCRPLCMHSKF